MRVLPRRCDHRLGGRDRDRPLTRPAVPALVAARGVSYTYPDGSAALYELSLEIRDGERLGLLGPNGCGKSTFLRLLAGDRVPGLRRDSSVDGARQRWLAPDQPALRSWLSGRENAATLLELHGARPREARAVADAWIERFGLSGDANRPVGTYSSGMRRRLALAVAFGVGPRLLLLDEPLAGLDPEGRAAFAAALADHRDAGGATVLSVHDPGFAAAHCDRVAFIVDGRCEVADAPARLLERIGIRPRVEIRFPAGGHPDRDALEPAPAGVRPVSWGAGSLLLEVGDPSRALPETLAWVLRAGASVASVNVREPGLADAFVILTGRDLEETARDTA
ncbi:MAG: ABC transporter ATP-binding protein [Gemmatimonadales bacterium]|nr:ABC transporter ATP-binding protein [Gemmatimonadales bacterium]